MMLASKRIAPFTLPLLLALSACSEPRGTYMGRVEGALQQDLEGRAIWCLRDLGDRYQQLSLELGEPDSDSAIIVWGGGVPSAGDRWRLADTLRHDADATLILPRLVRGKQHFMLRLLAGSVVFSRTTADSLYGEVDAGVEFWEQARPDTLPVLDTAVAGPPPPEDVPLLAGTGMVTATFTAARREKC